MLRALTIAVGVAGGLRWARRGGARHVVVHGPSMLPTVSPGDRLLLLRTPWSPRVGQLAVATDPRVADRLLLKRVHAVSADGVDLRGDNAGASTDSRVFGLVPSPTVRGYAVWRYAPARRAGRVR